MMRECYKMQYQEDKLSLG